jgi:hypothetical protein
METTKLITAPMPASMIVSTISSELIVEKIEQSVPPIVPAIGAILLLWICMVRILIFCFNSSLAYSGGNRTCNSNVTRYSDYTCR